MWFPFLPSLLRAVSYFRTRPLSRRRSRSCTCRPGMRQKSFEQLVRWQQMATALYVRAADGNDAEARARARACSDEIDARLRREIRRRVGEGTR
jgi:hypothetical protein